MAAPVNARADSAGSHDRSGRRPRGTVVFIVLHLAFRLSNVGLATQAETDRELMDFLSMLKVVELFQFPHRRKSRLPQCT